jgi:replication fork protection complex subunit Tof1/Swi1
MDPWEKSTTVDPEVRAYVTSLVNAVGGRSTYDDTYSVGDDAVAVLKDLQRWLRLYDEKTNRRDVKRVLAEANLVNGDLLEILALWPEDAQDNRHKAKLALACLELLVPLTWPLTLDIEKATVNHHRHDPYLQLAQVSYKRAVLGCEYAKILRTAVRTALPAIATPKRERTRRDEGIIKLVLFFFRNIAIITQPQHLPSQGDENEISRSATIEAFHSQDIFNVLLTIGSGMGDEFQEQDVILLDILFHLLKSVDARKLFMKKEQVATEETSELKNLLQREKAMLDSYKRHAPTRHNRFGTMIWVKRDDEKLSTVSGQTSMTNETDTLRQMDATKKWNKPLYKGKAQEHDEHSELGTRVDLTENARDLLRQFVEDFLDSSFNPLFSSLRRAIEREADRVLSTHIKQYFYLISWFLDAEAARRDQTRRNSAGNVDGAGPVTLENTFSYIAAVLDQETFVLLNRKMQQAFDEKNWQDLQATLLCFTQILLTVQSMAESKDEEDQEIAENIQTRIFYEEATHDRVVQILRCYTHQGFAYLDAITECVHVFVRMLERFSKQNVDLTVRSKRRARKRKQQSGEGGEDTAADAGENDEEAHEAVLTVSERKFDFARFSAKFLSQPCVDTFIALIHYYRDLTPAQLKRAHRYLYRLAFKHELAVLLFRVDILALLHKMVKGPEGLDPQMEGFKDWEQLVQQIFRRCIKWMERDTVGDGWKEAAVVEMLFSKIPNTLFYLQNGYEKVVEKRPPRPPAELEIKPTVPEEKRIGVATSLMIEQTKASELNWVKKQLQDAAAERQSWEDERVARTRSNEDGVNDTSLEPLGAPSIFITPEDDARKLSLFKDKHLRLLLKTLGFQRLGLEDDVDASWIIPSELSAANLNESLDQIKKAEFDPPTFEDEKTATDMVRSKAAARRATFDDNNSENGADAADADASGGEVDPDTVEPAHISAKRKLVADADKEKPKKRRKNNKHERTDEALEEMRRAREENKKKKRDLEKNRKSKWFVEESDDEEADAEFFRLEAERRRKTDAVIRKTLLKKNLDLDEDDDDGEDAELKKKRSGKKSGVSKRKKGDAITVDDDGLEDQVMLDIGDESSDEETDGAIPQPRRKRKSPAIIEISDAADDSATDSSSSIDDDEDEVSSGKKKAKRRHATVVSTDGEDDPEGEAAAEEESTPPSTSPPRTATSPPPLKEVSVNVRGGAGDDGEEDEDDGPATKAPSRARARTGRPGFIIEDSDDD